MSVEVSALCAADTEATAEAAARPHVPLRARLGHLRRSLRQVFGIPDFDRYREHMQIKHPEAPLLSEREFHAMAIDRRYGAGRARCC
jgi:uncharacterized short protein YbdD (DUF466 family)